jgi:hypothetical protein
VVGGDWNTSTYNSSRAVHAILGFWLRVLMGVDNVIRNHYLHPYPFRARPLPAAGKAWIRLSGMQPSGRAHGFVRRGRPARDQSPARLGARLVFPLHPLGAAQPRRTVSGEAGLVRHAGCALPNPVVIHDVREGRAVPLSDHDAIAVDILAG